MSGEWYAGATARWAHGDRWPSKMPGSGRVRCRGSESRPSRCRPWLVGACGVCRACLVRFSNIGGVHGCRASEGPRLGGAIAFMIGAMLTLFAALALAAQSTPVPPQATQLPPPVPPIPAPVTPVVEAEPRPHFAHVTALGTNHGRTEAEPTEVHEGNYSPHL